MLQTLDLTVGLDDVVAEGLGELRIGRSLLHLLESRRQMFLGPIYVLDLVDEELAELRRFMLGLIFHNRIFYVHKVVAYSPVNLNFRAAAAKRPAPTSAKDIGAGLLKLLYDLLG